MYLSRLILNPRSRQVQREIANRYQLHRTVLGAFSEALPPDERVLFRLDADARSGRLVLLVQSVHAPDWSRARLTADYMLPGAAPEVKEFHLPHLAGQVLAFRLRANPTVKKATHAEEPAATPGYVAQARERRSRGEKEPGRNGVRLGLAKEEDQRAWLARKGEQHGFRVLRAHIAPEGVQVSHSGRGAGGRRLAQLAVRYEGLLQVTDAELFFQAVREGIGSAKAFGFGLLSLARPEG